MNNSIPVDKIQHLIVGGIIALLVWYVCSRFDLFYAPVFGILAVIVIGWAKEYIYDVRYGGTVDDMDWVATIIGGVAAVAGVKLLQAFIW